MSNKAIDALVFCPFYAREGKVTITCEGIVGATTVSHFKSEKEKKEHENDFCTVQHCKGCGVYSAIMQNYMGARPYGALRH